MAGNPDRRRRYTDEQKATALEELKANGLAAAARQSGAAKSTVLAWAKAAGLDPALYADRSTDQNAKAAAASAAVRRTTMLANRAALADTLLGRLAPKAAELIAARLEEEATLAERLAADEERLEAAILALDALGQPDDPADPATVDERKVKAKMREEARERVKDATMMLRAHRDARVKVPELVGVLTRSVSDHLALEGDAEQVAGAEAFTVVITSPRPQRTPGQPGADPVASTPRKTSKAAP